MRTNDVDDAIRRGTSCLVESQARDGRWTAPGEVGPSATAQALVALRFAGLSDPDETAKATAWLRSQQRDDGGFVGWPFAEASDLGTTVAAWAAFQDAGPENEAAAAAARRYVEANGGLERVVARFTEGDLGALFAVMGGLLRRRRSVPVLPMLLPPLEGWFGRRFHGGIPFVAATWRALARPGPPRTPMGRLERRRSLVLLAEFQNQGGSFNGMVLQTAMLIGGLVALGLPSTDDRLQRAAAWLRRQKVGDRWPGFHLPVWSTVFDARALLRSGLAPGDPTLDRAVDWLLSQQNDLPQAARNRPRRGAPDVRTGGWSYVEENETMPDSDDTGAVLSLLGPVAAATTDPTRKARLQEAIDRGVRFVLGMQNDDGGFASYTTGLPGKPPGPILAEPFRLRFSLQPPLALGDPATEDVTGRVLEGLGEAGLRLDHPDVARAIAFLRVQQVASGAWWGRWMLNYLAATAYVLMGLAAVGVPPDDEMVARAMRWIRARQNPDGSWGETPASYRDASLAGVGPGCAPLTGLVICGLLASGERGDVVDRAVSWLVGRQEPSGAWPHDDYLTPLLLPDSFYFHGEAARSYPLEALGRWREAPARCAPSASSGVGPSASVSAEGRFKGNVRAR